MSTGERKRSLVGDAAHPGNRFVGSHHAECPVEIVVLIVEQQRLVGGIDRLHGIGGGFEKGVRIKRAERVFVEDALKGGEG